MLCKSRASRTIHAQVSEHAGLKACTDFCFWCFCGRLDIVAGRGSLYYFKWRRNIYKLQFHFKFCKGKSRVYPVWVVCFTHVDVSLSLGIFSEERRRHHGRLFVNTSCKCLPFQRERSTEGFADDDWRNCILGMPFGPIQWHSKRWRCERQFHWLYKAVPCRPIWCRDESHQRSMLRGVRTRLLLSWRVN